MPFNHSLSVLPSPILPMTKSEMGQLGWQYCDIILISGDAYIDHPSFGVGLIGRFLESQGYRVGVIAQPDWQSTADISRLGRPRLFFGISAGNMDSMVNHYTADGKIRSEDAYSPHGKVGLRPDRATIVYANLCRQAFSGVAIILGGMEASLRRLVHWDYWSEKMRRSILTDSKADMILYGNAERALLELCARLDAGQSVAAIQDIPGTVVWLPHSHPLVSQAETHAHTDKNYPLDRGTIRFSIESRPGIDNVIVLPAYDQIVAEPRNFAIATRILYKEANPHNGRPLLQRQFGPNGRYVLHNPPAIPLTEKDLDFIYNLPFSRQIHPSYGQVFIPAFTMIRHSVTIMRGCFGGCSFCAITLHEGKIIQSRSFNSINAEIDDIAAKDASFKGIISDIGGPTVNMYRLGCSNARAEASCRKFSCIFPNICPYLNTNHQALIRLYEKIRAKHNVKKAFVASGLRYDLALTSPQYIKVLAEHHVSGYLKVAPEHCDGQVLAYMMKPDISSYERFEKQFLSYCQAASKTQYLIPYFIAAHPGSDLICMADLAAWLKRRRIRPRQVQTFLPTPLTLATTMYCTGHNVLKNSLPKEIKLQQKYGLTMRRLQKAFLLYYLPENWPLLRKALKEMGRQHWIGSKEHCLIPAFDMAEKKSKDNPHQKGQKIVNKNANKHR